uniref:Lipase domain-containing protein n=1 Tax=Strongyloides stercoralis TaxID=6248 RepID=A0A0K0EHC4_STRER
MILKIFTIITILIVYVTCEFTEDFREYILTKYGQKYLETIERLDMGSNMLGSFGGKESSTEVIKRRPIIFIHGTMLRAGIFKQHRKMFMSRGYQGGELYGTTFGDGGQTPLLQKPMFCQDVKIVRKLIEAVINYANSTVDVIGYSMGAAITRKAIFGGKCVDTGEELGIPLTNYIHTYISVAGVTYGFESCATIHSSNFACNLINGMHCRSKFLQELNNQTSKFEGRHTFGILSREDGLVGLNCCGNGCSNLKFADANFSRNSNSHFSIVHQTRELMYDLIIGRFNQIIESW